MSARLLSILIRVAAIVGFGLIALRICVDMPAGSAWTAALLAILTTLIYLYGGIVTGSLATVLLAFTAEGLSQLPAGQMMFASFSMGLILLHLARIESWSKIGRGFVMAATGAAIWTAVIEFFVTTDAATTVNWQQLGQSSLQSGLSGGGLWLAAGTLWLGLRGMYREVATRPVRFGGRLD